MKKHSIFKILGVVILVYLIYQSAVFVISDFQITDDKNSPKMKLSEIINISEERVQYELNNYIRKDFVGFNAFIDNKYFITITKLGKISTDFKLTQTNKKLKDNPDFNFFSFSNIEDKSGRYIDLHNFPFDTKQVYYFTNGKVCNINRSQFYEIERIFSLFNISFGNEITRDFGYVGFEAKQSISFIN